MKFSKFHYCKHECLSKLHYCQIINLSNCPMFYLLQKSYLHIQECVIEANSFEEAKKKAKTSDDWYWREEFLDSEGYRASEDEEDVHGEDYVPLDDIEF